MRKILTILLVLGSLGGGAWLIWRFTAVGQNTLSDWLLKR